MMLSNDSDFRGIGSGSAFYPQRAKKHIFLPPISHSERLSKRGYPSVRRSVGWSAHNQFVFGSLGATNAVYNTALFFR